MNPLFIAGGVVAGLLLVEYPRSSGPPVPGPATDGTIPGGGATLGGVVGGNVGGDVGADVGGSKTTGIKSTLVDIGQAATLGIFSPQAADVRNAVGDEVGTVLGAIIPTWVWGVLIVGGVAVGGYFLLRSGVFR